MQVSCVSKGHESTSTVVTCVLPAICHLGIVKYLVFFAGFAVVVVVVGFGGLLLSFLLLGFFCVALVGFDFFGLVCFCLSFWVFFFLYCCFVFFNNQTSGLKFFTFCFCSG